MSKPSDEPQAKLHKFEQAGLGRYPFKLVGYQELRGPLTLPNGAQVGSPGQPMGCCDYCGMGIAHCFYIRSSDGKKFMVGSECVYKTGDGGLKKVVKAKVNALRREARRARDAEKIAEGRTWAEEHREAMGHEDHPRGFTNLTLADYYDWMMENAGNSGKLEAIRTIRRILEGGER